MGSHPSHSEADPTKLGSPVATPRSIQRRLRKLKVFGDVCKAESPTGHLNLAWVQPTQRDVETRLVWLLLRPPKNC